MPTFIISKARQMGFSFQNRLLKVSPPCQDFLEDYLLAARYCYYVRAKPIMPDAEYDKLERAFLSEEGHESSTLNFPGSDLPESYHPSIQALSVYLLMSKYEREQAAQGKPSDPAAIRGGVSKRKK